jgi:hypothetical protein
MTFHNYLRAFIIILLTGILGGAIAHLGNQLGRYIGRRKMSIFKLRPRHTSMLITMFTGMMIASITLVTAMFISEPVRITLLDPNGHRERVADLEEKIAKLRSLQNTELVYKNQDIIISAVINAESELEKMELALKEIISAVNDAALKKSYEIAHDRGEVFTPPPGGRLVGYIPENLESVARDLTRLQGEQVIFARAHQHASLGDVFPVELGTPLTNNLIFKKGEMVYKAKIDGTKDYFVIYDQLLRVIKEDISQLAIYRGLFPNPEDRSVGELDDNKLKELAREIKKQDREVVIDFFSQSNTYLLGPLMIDFRMSHEN